MEFLLEYHWLIIVVFGVALLWGVSLALVRRWTLRQALPGPPWPEAETLDFDLPDPGPQDQAALELIRRCRRRYLLHWWPGTDFSFKVIHEMSLDLLKGIARVYYPREERPELRASLADLVALHNRVGARLAAWLETMPMRPFKDLELGTVLRCHEIYQSVKQHPGYAFIKRHRLDKLVRWGVTLYNYANPWHWGGRAVYHGGKEVAARLLLARIADLVGEEAVLLYGRRLPRQPVDPGGTAGRPEAPQEAKVLWWPGRR